ncbi:hypothetical protein V2J09_013267 [Rumex salicifolius]
MRDLKGRSLMMLLLLVVVAAIAGLASSKSTIEPCSNSDDCNAMVGYSLYTDLKVSEVATLFSVDTVSLLLANGIDISYPDVENHILPSSLFLKIPISCSCVNGIRKSVSTRYKTRPSDTLSSIADSVYAGLVSSDQLQEANSASVSDPSVLEVGLSLVVPLPCTCFNGTDNGLPAVYLSYVVQPVDTLAALAARYQTTLTDLMDVNAMGTPSVDAGDILAIPLSACASNFPSSSSDYGLIVPNGSYAITASHCVQCSCGPGSRNLYCMPSSLAVSCSSMQCRSSNLMVGNVTTLASSAGCNVTSCSYGGFVNSTISTVLLTSLQPRCPGQQLFPALSAPPTTVGKESIYSPSAAPGSSVSLPPSGSVPGFSTPTTAAGPSGALPGTTTSPSLLLLPQSSLMTTSLIFLLFVFILV